MKRRIRFKAGALAAFVGLGIGSPHSALASGGPSIGYAQACELSILLPENVDDYYMSEDCKNVYVVPKRGGKLDLIAADYSVSAQFCEQLGNVDEDIIYYDKAKKEIQRQREFFHPGSAKYSELTILLEKEEALLKDAKREKLAMLEDDQGRFRAGARLQVHFEKTNLDAVVRDTREINITHVENGKKFFATPIAESFISITNSDKYKKDLQAPEVVAAYLPLIKRESDDPATLTFLFNGSASGEIYLSAEKGCQMRKELGSNLSLVNPAKLSSYLVANQTYTVPLGASFGYKAVLKFDHLVLDFLKFTQEKSKFTVKEYKDHLSLSGTTDSISVEIKNGEMSPEIRERLEKMGYFDDLVKDIQTDLTTVFLEIIKSHNLLVAEDSQLSAPEAGVEQQAQVGYQCHTKKSWGGLKKSSNCGNYTYYVPVNVNGYADQVRELVNKVGIEITREMRINETIYRYHTSSMIPVPVKK